MFRLIVRLFAFFGFFCLLVIAGGGFAVYQFSRGDEPSLPQRFTLYVDMRQQFPEAPVENATTIFDPGQTVTMDRLVFALQEASRDDRVKAVFLRHDGRGRGIAQAQEIVEQLKLLRDNGKKIFAWSDGFGDFGPGNIDYMIASASDEIYLQPGSAVGLTGIAFEATYFGTMLRKYGIEPQVYKRSEYKSALDSFNESEMSEAEREVLDSLADELYLQITTEVANNRSIGPDQLTEIINQAPVEGQQAVEWKLIDGLEPIYQTRKRAEELTASEDFIHIEEYAAASLSGTGIISASSSEAKNVALIRTSGTVIRGDDELGENVAADSMRSAIADALDDEQIDAILLRISTGGGSAIASETISLELDRAREMGVPVIVSMGDAAASGGYWIAAKTDEIVAQKGTFTGSIGVVAGLPLVQQLAQSLEIGIDKVQRGDNANLWSFLEAPSEEGVAAINRSLDVLYERFKSHVSDGRNLSPEEVEKVARGRVWLGSQAMDLGLVDKLGGYTQAVASLRNVLELEDEQHLNLHYFPQPKPPIEALLSILEEDLGFIGSMKLLYLQGTRLLDQGVAYQADLPRSIH